MFKNVKLHPRKRKMFFILLCLLSVVCACDEDFPHTPNPQLPLVPFEAKVYLSPTAGATNQAPLDYQIMGNIRDATHSVLVFLPNFDNMTVADALIKAKGRGLKVSFVTNDEGANTSAVQKLKQNGIEVKTAMVNLNGRSVSVYHRYILIDELVLWVGSNLLSSQVKSDSDYYSIRFSEPALAEVFKILFNGEYTASRAPFSRIASEDSSRLADYSYVTPRFSPRDDDEDYLVKQINNATSSIKFLSSEFTSKKIADALIQQAGKGRVIKGVIDGDTANLESSQLVALKQKGLDIRIDGHGGRMNHQVMIIDDRHLILGSDGLLPKDKHIQQLLDIEEDLPLLNVFRNEFDRVYALSLASSS